MNRHEGVIFDLDGTLADTLDDIADAMNRVLTRQGLPTHDRESYKYFVGKGMSNLVTQTVPVGYRTEESVRRSLEMMTADYQENCLVKTRLYDGIAEIIHSLKDHGIKLAVFSNKPDVLTKKIVDALIGIDKFAMVIGAQQGMPAKPDPAGALFISSALGIAPGSILYLGDTDVDMMTANNAGMVAVGVLWGFRTKDELLANGAKAIISQPRELYTIAGIS